MFDLFLKERIYLDYASATPLLPESGRALAEAERWFANPGAIHSDGVAARKALEEAREGVAHELGCKARQVIFTSGLSESNNLAILGYARNITRTGGDLSKTHWIVSSIEHDSVLECFAEIERLGGVVSYLDPESDGRISALSLGRVLRKETVLVSIGWANNEIGVIQPMSELARVIRLHERNAAPVLFHSDAGQAPLYLSPQVHTLGVDMFSLGAGKLYGPRSVGALFVNDLSCISPIILGGGQEKGLRAGTEHVVPAIGFAKAFAVVASERDTEYTRVKTLRDMLAKRILEEEPEVIVNGTLKHSLPHMLNISIPNISSEYTVLALDRAGIAISTKSACRSGEQSSHVVAVLGENPPAGGWRAKNTLRFSLGRDTKAGDIPRVVNALRDAIILQRTTHTNIP